MAEGLLAGVRVVDLAGEPAAITGRILADLGADVVRVEPPSGDPLRRQDPLRFAAFRAGERSVTATADDPSLTALLAAADVVIATPGWPGTVDADPASAPQSVWVDVTPFGREGPRAGWRAADLGVMASSGNMYATGDPDRAPVRCTEPSGYAHVGPETAMAALTGLASGRPQRIDVSMQETILVANMSAQSRYPKTGFRGRRSGAQTGRTREIWPCKDGFVSFGLRGGKARVPNLQTITRLLEEAGLGSPALSERDWSAYNVNTVTDEEIAAIQEPIARYFAERTMADLYEIACQTHLMLAPANSPKELYASAQLAAREYFDDEGYPRFFVNVRSVDGEAAPATRKGPAPDLGAGPVPTWTPRAAPPADGAAGGGAWAHTKIVEFGSGAAGPIATRFFAEHGATVVRVESKSRPDFLRIYALGPNNPHGLEGSDMFDALNCGKLGVTLNMKHPKGVEIAKRLAQWADAVAENFAPKAMKGFGMDYDTLAREKPDLVMVSANLQGQTGPHKDYPGFGGQGSALAGFNHLTGWPDREPLGPSGTITDSLAPRFVAVALAAGLHYRRRTGRGVYLDLAQVEAALYTLAPWLLEYKVNGRSLARDGNRSRRVAPHGAFACEGKDRWVAIAVWEDDEWERLAKIAGIDDPSLGSNATRLERIDEVESLVAAWAAVRSREEVVEALQGVGVEAVAVNDYADLIADPQLAFRGHFQTLTHPIMGEGLYERNGFRLSDETAGYQATAPTLGQHNDYVLGDILGIPEAERESLAADGVLE
jgi:crotonobetainyl-CoA:carnitine CoA-transferase CaiB-like acyl-CoA transferase